MYLVFKLFLRLGMKSIDIHALLELLHVPGTGALASHSNSAHFIGCCT